MIPWSEFGCGGWYERLNLKTIPPSLPCGGDDPAHYRDFHPEIAVVHREAARGLGGTDRAVRAAVVGLSPPLLVDRVGAEAAGVENVERALDPRGPDLVPALRVATRDPEPRSLILDQAAGRHGGAIRLRWRAGGGAGPRGDFIRPVQPVGRAEDYRVDSACLQLNDRAA